MGISRSAYKLFLEEKQKKNIAGNKVMQLGRQHTFVTLEELKDLAIQFKIRHSTNTEILYKKLLKNHQGKYANDIELFSMLDFDTIHSIDVSNYEDATFVHDLNVPVPRELHDQYDLIFDGGTVEHVFSTHQALKNIHNMLKPGGVIIHASPTHNFVDHGFYMFSPLMFHDYYSVNSYQILTSYLLEHPHEYAKYWDVYEYKPGTLEHLSFGGFGKNLIGTWFVAQKKPHSTEGKIPQQGDCLPKRKQMAIEEPEVGALRTFVKKSKIIHEIGKKIKRKMIQAKTKKENLIKVGRY